MTTKSKDIALSYLKTLKLKPSKSIRPFWASLYERHDKKKIDQLVAAVDSRADGDKILDVYTLKNENLRLSMDFANFSADLYRRYFEWFQKRATSQPKDILDIGCDNGIVTCFYATLFPEAKVVGIDTNKEGIESAKELARNLSLTNVTFVQGDIREIHSLLPDQTFDMITSLRSLHECAGEFPEPAPHWTTREVLMEETHEPIQELLGITKGLLRDKKSEFITCERLGWLGSIAQWAKELEAACLYIDWKEAAYIQFHEVGDNQIMPVFVSSKQGTSVGTDELLNQLYEFEISEKNISHGNGEYQDAQAEIIMVQTKDKTLLQGAEIRFLNGSGTMRFELWSHQDLVLFYQSSNMGFRHLQIVSEEEKQGVKEKFQEVLQQYRGQEIKIYETPQN